MSYILKVMKDHPVGFWSLDESSGNIAYDKSGCENNGTYVNSPESNMLSLIPGGVSGTKIDLDSYVTFPTSKNFYNNDVGGGLGTKYTSDNDFTIEVWFYQNISTSSETPLLADTTNDIGLYWHNGDVVFKVSENESVRYCVPYSKKSMHLTGVYSVDRITLYLDSVPVASKSLNNFKFNNTSLLLQAGPTSDAIDSFIVDAPAVYRYSLNQSSIRRHYIDGNVTVSPIHVVYPDNGVLFSGTDANIRASFDYSYPVNRPWNDFTDSNTYYDINRKHITFYQTDTVESKTFVINDFFLIPSQIGLNTSKVEWRNDIGIEVESSVDGVNYLACKNGEPLPQYNLTSFDSSGKVYFRITMSTEDSSKFLPQLSFFCITFYSDRTIYADNFGDKITSSEDYYLGSLNYPILSRNYMNGIRPKSGTGFDLHTESSIRSVEMFFTPLSLEASTLFYNSDLQSGSTRIDWTSNGILSKQNIKKLYVNGQDVSSVTDVNLILSPGQPHHIIFTFNNPISELFQFNYEASGGPSNLYKNIAIYEKELFASDVETHFELYTGKPVDSVTESAIAVTELQPSYYNNDWIVLQSV